ncbi:hydrolase [Acidihalobacter aeolianus]|uniref:Hydrolase n=1 Tax=Acidihalobacter aeolianus TaxID=2792603 RepID=A0A1D8K5G3_9GAMM|nr:isochorismatase family protein [Acidihalobacter aeolianus]AOV16190.1 hydrolase [Acidihalobacter aeolianus]
MSAAAPLCRAGDSRLLLIDIQERLLGAMPAADSERVLRCAGILARAAALLDVPAVLSEQYPRGLGPTHASLAEALADDIRPIEKTRFSCCDVPAYREALQADARRQTVIAGVEAHVCVLQTALELQTEGWEVFVVEDATCSRDPANAANALARLRQAGVVVSNTESVIFEWLGDAAHPQFKAISALIR